MNELIDSDPELYEADYDIPKVKKKTEKELLKADIKKHINGKDLIGADGLMRSPGGDSKNGDISDQFDADEISLEDPDNARERYNSRKAQEAKIHNSFTGPYPLDPTEFSHTDKGENYQFTRIF